MIKKGSMQLVKKILGIVAGIVGIGIVLGISAINNIVANYGLIFGVILLIIAYFLVISGRQS